MSTISGMEIGSRMSANDRIIIGPRTTPIIDMSSNAASKSIFVVLLALSLAPVLLTPIPAMVDYPNHLARMYILSRDGTPAAHPLYRVIWALYPNLAMDLLVPRLARLVNVEIATRIFLLVSQLLIVSGAVVIERVVKGRFHIAGIAAVMLLYSLPFAFGFLNFQFGLGLALWGIACMILAQERAWALRLGINGLFTATLCAAHIFALGVYGVTLGLLELRRAWVGKPSHRETLGRLLILALPAVAMFGVMLATDGAAGGTGTAWTWKTKLVGLLFLLNGYSIFLSIPGTVILFLLLYTLAKQGRLRLGPGGGWLAAGFMLLFLAIPTNLITGTLVDIRVATAAGLILPAFMTVSLPSPRWRRGVLLVVLLLALINIGYVLSVWMFYRSEYGAMITSFGRLEKGASILVGYSRDQKDPPFKTLADYPIYHAPVLAVHYADAFVPTLFTAHGQQPVLPRPDYQHLDIPVGAPIPSPVLKAIWQGQVVENSPPFIRAWHRDFDYLYIVGPRRPNPIPQLLEQIDAGSRFVLYRIRKQGRPAPTN